MEFELMSEEDIASMHPDRLREYAARLSNAYVGATAEVDECLGAKLTADTALKRAQNRQGSFKTQMSLVQSLLKSTITY